MSMAGQHPCLLISDCAEWAVKTTEEIVDHQKVVLHTRHQINKLLTNTHLFSTQMKAKWEATLLSKNMETQINSHNVIHPVSLLPDEETAYNCVQLIENNTKCPLEPLPNAMKLFVDGSSCKVNVSQAGLS